MTKSQAPHLKKQSSKTSSSCLFFVLAVPLLLLVVDSFVSAASAEEQKTTNEHTNNWAVIVDTSRFWFNYRHAANVLSIYRSVKRLGIPDSHIILMLSDDMACNTRNPRPGTVFNNENEVIDVYGDDIEVDYRGNEVTVKNFIRMLTGRLPEATPHSKKLMTDETSNILIYMSGHGGDGFLKFQDSEEISDIEFGDVIEQMWQKKRYNQILFMIDTCQAESMFLKIYSPNVVSIGSSKVGEDSLSHHIDSSIGVYVIDRFTYYALEFLERVTQNSRKTIQDLFNCCPKEKIISTAVYRTDLYPRDISKVLVTEFFGNVRSFEFTPDIVQFTSFNQSSKSDL